jgi:hypothetical protein
VKQILTIIIASLIVISCEPGSESSSTDPTEVTLDAIEEEAAELGNYPSEAEVVDIDDLEVNGVDIDGTDSVELEDTENSEIEVDVTLPDQLSRSRSNIDSFKVWINGGYINVDFDLETASGTFNVPLNIGVNYFCLVFTSNGKSYRSAMIKIKRIEVSNKIETTVNIVFDRALVSSIGTITVSADASDMTAVNTTISGGTAKSYTATLSVTEGSNRTFTVLAQTAASDTSAALEYKGELTSNISSSANSVSITMKIHKAKLVVSDHNNNRMLQFDDMTTAGFKNLKESDLSLTAFSPSDVDFDNAGRIYFSNNTGSGSDTEGVWRIDNFDDLSPERIAGDDVEYIKLLSIDNTNNKIYFSLYNQLFVKTIGVSDQTEIISTGFLQGDGDRINGIYAASNGLLYLSGKFKSGAMQLLCLNVVNPSSPIIVYENAFVNPGSNDDPLEDLIMFKDEIYVGVINSTSGPASDNLLVKFTADLSIQSNHTSTTLFSGPIRFLALRPEDIVFLDDDGSGVDDTVYRITGFDDTVAEGLANNSPDGEPLKFFMC